MTILKATIPTILLASTHPLSYSASQTGHMVSGARGGGVVKGGMVKSIGRRTSSGVAAGQPVVMVRVTVGMTHAFGVHTGHAVCTVTVGVMGQHSALTRRT